MTLNVYRHLSAYLPTFSRKRKARAPPPAVPRPLRLLAIAIPFVTMSAIFLVLAILTDLVGGVEAQLSALRPPWTGTGDDIEGRVASFPDWTVGNGAAIEKELHGRLKRIGLPPAMSTCPALSPALQHRYSHLIPTSHSSHIISPHGFFFALNLFNSHLVVPTLFETLLSVASLVGPSNVHISIFENGSTDKTPDAMAQFARALTSAGIAHTIRSSNHTTDWSSVDRIEQLAVYRNIALSPLLAYSPLASEPLFPFSSSSHRPEPTDLVFINDVFVCPTDVLELLHQRRFQHADATCGMDWVEAPRGATWGWARGWLGENYRFYDNWVTRTLEGFPLRPRFDLFGELRDGLSELFAGWDANPFASDRFHAGLPTPVYSCYNGIIALDARPFLSSFGGVKFRSARREEEGECAHSECTIIAKDLWSLGYTRWVLLPRVATTYTLEAYDSSYLHTRVRRRGSLPSLQEEKINWDEVPKGPEQVVCWEVYKGAKLEIWPFYKIAPPTNIGAPNPVHPPQRDL